MLALALRFRKSIAVDDIVNDAVAVVVFAIADLRTILRALATIGVTSVGVSIAVEACTDMAGAIIAICVCIGKAAQMPTCAAVRGIVFEIDAMVATHRFLCPARKRAISGAVARVASSASMVAATAIGSVVLQIGTMIATESGVDTTISARTAAAQKVSTAAVTTAAAILRIEIDVLARVSTGDSARRTGARAVGADLRARACLLAPATMGVVGSRVVALSVRAKPRTTRAGKRQIGAAGK